VPHDQVLVDQRSDPVEDALIRADRLRGLDSPASDEGGKRGEQAPFGFVKQAVAPVPGDGDPMLGEADNVLTNVENVEGGSGSDDLFGSGIGNGLYGNAGGDWLVGNDGNDSLDGGAGGDYLVGGFGDDHIYAQDGEHDAIDCGPGFDVLYAEPFDFIIGGCEAVLFGN
jgi:hypothetical protein